MSEQVAPDEHIYVECAVHLVCFACGGSYESHRLKSARLIHCYPCPGHAATINREGETAKEGGSNG